jgi:hypothetical protein
VSAGRIGAPRPGARGQAALSSDSLVGLVQRSPTVSLGGVGSSLVGCLPCVVEGAISPVFVVLSLFCFVRGFPHHFVSVGPFGFIYKAGRKPVLSSSEAYEPKPLFECE